MKRDIVVTWPKSTPLKTYLHELSVAVRAGQLINYRVARRPVWDDQIEDHGWQGWEYGVDRPRCYMVHTRFVRGWCEVLGTCWREDGEVFGWREGWYVVRAPVWNPITPVPMRGFQGWRWYDGRDA